MFSFEVPMALPSCSLDNVAIICEEAHKTSDLKCILCNSTINDPLQMGEKKSNGKVTAHQFCMVRNLLSL